MNWWTRTFHRILKSKSQAGKRHLPQKDKNRTRTRETREREARGTRYLFDSRAARKKWEYSLLQTNTSETERMLPWFHSCFWKQQWRSTGVLRFTHSVHLTYQSIWENIKRFVTSQATLHCVEEHGLSSEFTLCFSSGKTRRPPGAFFPRRLTQRAKPGFKYETVKFGDSARCELAISVFLTEEYSTIFIFILNCHSFPFHLLLCTRWTIPLRNDDVTKRTLIRNGTMATNAHPRLHVVDAGSACCGNQTITPRAQRSQQALFSQKLVQALVCWLSTENQTAVWLDKKIFCRHIPANHSRVVFHLFEPKLLIQFNFVSNCPLTKHPHSWVDLDQQ